MKRMSHIASLEKKFSLKRNKILMSDREVSCFVGCFGAKPSLKYKIHNNTSRLGGRTLSGYSNHSRPIETCFQKLASTFHVGRTSCHLRTLVASPPGDQLNLFNEAVVGDHKVVGFMFLHKGSVLCLDTPSTDSSLFVNLGDIPSIERCLRWLDLTHIIVDLHSGMSNSVENCEEYISNLVTAAKNCQMRLILLSSIGAGDSACVVPSEIAPVIRQQLKTQTHVEHLVRNSGIVHTILRIGPLEERLKTGQAIVTESPKGYGSISKQDLVDIIFKTLTSKHAENRTLSCLDSQRTFQMSPYMRPLEFWEPLPFELFEL
ncbi:NAD-dependent epimerase/dehydratase [Galdieria sulphuraria]|uniref:NAD-dependent epimerase/dehydratase n=1 Tax=Galdieria sulphuraria TaxID=130081 RepID=M2XRE7_GALSU|nr:NAD-dependent epimerase/dehydratase [Galdieria sulphuraria]EME26238.1 NAD-dependent epimerase/dehydratase [Galdieria sulphuraria]|eukprot:XP_005702758.1 NAD-dependent epimerase/dehydratase [Galdieria sulphuraria]